MNVPPLSDLSAEYCIQFTSCVPNPARVMECQALCSRISANEDRYQTVALVFPNQLPWFVIALIHAMEASLNFGCHLHNGDPLTRRTVNEPAGRPLGQPPFTWEESAKDALRFDRFDSVASDDWKSVPGILYHLEGYNGWGTRLYHNIRTPYLWGASNIEQPGKYVRDGKWDPTARTAQIGAAVLLAQLCRSHIVSLPATAA